MLNTDDLIQTIIDKEDELTQSYNRIIEKEVKKYVIKKYGEESKKYLDTYFDDSSDNDISDDLCPDCTKTARDMLAKVDEISNNISILNNEFNSEILDKLNDCLPLKLKIIDMVKIKINQLLTSMGYTRIDDSLVNRLTSLYLLNLSLLKGSEL